MIRILHIVTYMGRGGLETFLMSCYRHIDRNQIQFDFLVHRSFRADYDDEIEALGGRIFRLPRLNPFSPGYYRELNSFFKSHPEYRIVHCHLDCMSAIPLSAAKKQGVPTRIAHAHNADQDRDWKYPLKRIFMTRIPAAATHFFACSQAAGSWMFPGQFVTVIRNGIDAEAFRFSPSVRDTVRAELNLDNKLVIGHAGRFMPQKNHTFLLDVFSQLHKQHPDSALLLIGQGPLEDRIRQKVSELGLADSVHFLGVQQDVSRFYQAMDVLVFPSLYEGFGIVPLEAQTSGLPCILSDVIPADCIVSDLVTTMPLTASAEEWAKDILSITIFIRCSCQESIRDAGFDIQSTADTLHHFYLDHWSMNHE